VKIKLSFISLIVLLPGCLLAQQDISGKWQGILHQDKKDFRMILKIEKAKDGNWHGEVFSPDATQDWERGLETDSLIQKEANVKFAVPIMQGAYEGTLSGDGNSIRGTWTEAQPAPLNFERVTPETEWKEPVSYAVQYVTVDSNVKLEVLDWGGSGRPLVFLTGLGGTAHGWNNFAPKFNPAYHVYGITRRGFGRSSVPASGYEADRLGDDVIAVLDALKLDKPILVGESIGGEELSSVGSRHPERVAGLVYLDAAFSYAYYDGSLGDFWGDLLHLRKKLDQLSSSNPPADKRPLIQELIEKDLPGFEKDLKAQQKILELFPPPREPAQPQVHRTPAQAIRDGEQEYTSIPVPILAIYAIPYNRGPNIDAKVWDVIDAKNEAQAKAFEKGVPTARVVRLPHADHLIYISNEADVLREMNAFLATLK
jgi:non-heme chloroperoxidase